MNFIQYHYSYRNSITKWKYFLEKKLVVSGLMILILLWLSFKRYILNQILDNFGQFVYDG